MRRLIVAALLVLPGSVALCADPPSYQDGVIASSIKNLQDTTVKIEETTAQLSTLRPPEKTAGRPTWTVTTDATPPAVVTPRAVPPAPQAAAPTPEPQPSPVVTVTPTSPTPPTVVVTAEPPSAVSVAFNEALKAMLIAMIPVITGFIVAALNKLRAKYGVEATAKNTENMENDIKAALNVGVVKALPTINLHGWAYEGVAAEILGHATEYFKQRYPDRAATISTAAGPETHVNDAVYETLSGRLPDVIAAAAASPATPPAPAVPQSLAPLPEPVVSPPPATNAEAAYRETVRIRSSA